ncbi:MAG TPA: SCO family protein [Terriglobales bacterium]|nr:SCO family protein [Terriglobales bacterium]
MKLAGKIFLVLLCCSAFALPEQSYSGRGLLLKVDQVHKTVLVSSDAIPGYMEAMTMLYSVRDTQELRHIAPGTLVDFTLVVGPHSSFVKGIHVHKYQGLEPDPLTARRLRLLNQVVNPSTTTAVRIGESVPDFTLIDQNRGEVTLSNFAGKVIVLNFIYTRCALPNFCFRSSNNLGLLQQRFRQRLGRDLVMLTVTFDPTHDDPVELAKYAATWKADSNNWHFLTGAAPDVRRVCELFGEEFFQDEGLMAHSLHTAIINRKGKLVANLEGNEFSAQQLGDLVQQVLTASFEKAAQ